MKKKQDATVTMGANVRSDGRVVLGMLLFRNRSQSRLLSLICIAGALMSDYSEGYFGVVTRAHIYLRVFRQKLSSFIISRSICVKRRNELKMKPAAVIHMLSPRNFKIGSYTRSPHVGGLAAVSRHLAVVHRGGGGLHIYIYICL